MTSPLYAQNRDENTVLLTIYLLRHLEGIENDLMNELVHESVLNEGLLEPLTIWKCTEEEWNAYADKVQGVRRAPDKGLNYMVMTGNNRLRAAKRIGFTHIDCRVFCSEEEAKSYAQFSRKRSKGWKEEYKERFK